MEDVVLVDRGDINMELPITDYYVGGFWGTAPKQTINVYLEEAGFHDHVTIEEKKAA